jgi:hypothetical protein
VVRVIEVTGVTGCMTEVARVTGKTERKPDRKLTIKALRGDAWLYLTRSYTVKKD